MKCLQWALAGGAASISGRDEVCCASRASRVEVLIKARSFSCAIFILNYAVDGQFVSWLDWQIGLLTSWLEPKDKRSECTFHWQRTEKAKVIKVIGQPSEMHLTSTAVTAAALAAALPWAAHVACALRNNQTENKTNFKKSLPSHPSSPQSIISTVNCIQPPNHQAPPCAPKRK